jgi:hypothetical protein
MSFFLIKKKPQLFFLKLKIKNKYFQTVNNGLYLYKIKKILLLINM